MSGTEKENSIFEIVSLVISAIAIVVAVISGCLSCKNSKDIATYQIEQERMPNVIGFNEEVKRKIVKPDDMRSADCFKDINTNSISIGLSVNNIGIGISQNCKVIWNEKSIENAYTKILSLLSEKINILENDKNEVFDVNWLSYAYIIKLKNDERHTLYYYNKVTNEYVTENFQIEDAYFPYILPITISEDSKEFQLPTTFTLLLMEAAYQNIELEIPIELNVEYQDMVGEKYIKTFEVIISTENIEETNEDIEVTYLFTWKEKEA